MLEVIQKREGEMYWFMAFIFLFPKKSTKLHHFHPNIVLRIYVPVFNAFLLRGVWIGFVGYGLWLWKLFLGKFLVLFTSIRSKELSKEIAVKNKHKTALVCYKNPKVHQISYWSNSKELILIYCVSS